MIVCPKKSEGIVLGYRSFLELILEGGNHHEKSELYKQDMKIENLRFEGDNLTLIMLKTASTQLVLNGFLELLGLQSHMKSTPHMFPLWFLWLTHWRKEKKKKTAKDVSKVSITWGWRKYFERDVYPMSITVGILVSNIIWWYKPLRSQEFVDMPTLASIPITEIRIVQSLWLHFTGGGTQFQNS